MIGDTGGALSAVPTLRLGGSQDTSALVAAIDGACTSTRAFLVTDHGVPRDTVAAVEAATRRFFALPTAAKREAGQRPANPYCGFATGADVQRPVGDRADLVETFVVSRFDTAADAMRAGCPPDQVAEHPANPWPAQVPEMRTSWHRYMAAMADLSGQLLRLCALALDRPADWFADAFTRHASGLAANHYPASSGQPAAGQQRRSVHTDFGCLTIIHQDTDVGGLLTKASDGTWHRVPAVPDAFAVIIGDLLARWTGGRWRATEHRVANPPATSGGANRLSFAYFYHPNRDAVVAPIDTASIDPAQPLSAGDWVRRRETAGERLPG